MAILSKVYLDEGEIIDTDFSAEAIEQCFETEGYVVLATQDKKQSYMITPRCVNKIVTNFDA